MNQKELRAWYYGELLGRLLLKEPVSHLIAYAEHLFNNAEVV